MVIVSVLFKLENLLTLLLPVVVDVVFKLSLNVLGLLNLFSNGDETLLLPS